MTEQPIPPGSASSPTPHPAGPAGPATPTVGPQAVPRAPFGERLAAAMADRGPLCVGLDPHAPLLERWGLPDTADGVRTFCRTVLEAVDGACSAIKPQSAFFERHGSAGVAVLEEVLAECSARGLLSVLDVKRGDIGSTMGAYAEAYLGEGSALAADSVTVSPYLGYGSLRPAVELALATGRGLWVLGLTSNPEGASIQRVGDPSVAARVVAEVAADNAGARPFGSVGLVVGATLPAAPADLGVDLVGAAAPVLAPGVGAQGADEQDVARTFAGLADRVLVPLSRAVLGEGPDPERLRASAIAWTSRLTSALAPERLADPDRTR